MLKSTKIAQGCQPMTLEKILESIRKSESAITTFYAEVSEHFDDDSDIETFWEEMYHGRKEHLFLLEKCQQLVPINGHAENGRLPGKDIQYETLLKRIGEYQSEVAGGNLPLNRAFQIAFHIETLSIQCIFNEMIRLPQEPFFQILSEIHLGVRRNMGKLIRGIERYCTDTELLQSVAKIKERVVERRSGEDRRAGRESYDGGNRRNDDRRKGHLVKIIWY